MMQATPVMQVTPSYGIPLSLTDTKNL